MGTGCQEAEKHQHPQHHQHHRQRQDQPGQGAGCQEAYRQLESNTAS